jgi:hypothetical protein
LLKDTLQKELSIVPDANPVPDTLDSVLRKYGKIWIWSILSAAVAALSTRGFSGVSFALSSLANSGVRSELTSSLLFLSLVAIVPSACTLVAVWYLLLFLRHHIVPVLFPPSSHEEATEADAPSVSWSDGGRLLWHAFAAVVLALAADLAVALLSFIYRQSPRQPAEVVESARSPLPACDASTGQRPICHVARACSADFHRG